MILQSDLSEAAAVIELGQTIYRESSNQEYAVKLAVGCSIMDRVTHPKWWGDSVLAVVGKRLQYSSMTAPNDPNLIRWPLNPKEQAWLDCLSAAHSAYYHDAPNPAPGADSYYDISMKVPPTWAKDERFVIQLGRIKFYDSDDDVEMPALKAAGHHYPATADNPAQS